MSVRECTLISGVRWLSMLLIIGIATTSQAASFDCAKASTKVEKMICADDELSRLDSELNSNYQRFLRAIDKESAIILKQIQLDWMKVRNECENRECVYASYVDRNQELQLLITEYQEVIDDAKLNNKKEWKYISYQVKKLSMKELERFIKNPRPKDIYDLSYSKNDDKCTELLSIMNMGGGNISQFNGIASWWLSNNEIAEWHIISSPNIWYQFVENTQVDINGDGNDEFIYRISTNHGGSSLAQKVRIFDRQVPMNIPLDVNGKSDEQHNQIVFDSLKSSDLKKYEWREFDVRSISNFAFSPIFLRVLPSFYRGGLMSLFV